MMQELLPSQFNLVKNLFTKNQPNYSVVQAIIEQNNPGKIWVDNIQHPYLCLVISKGSYSFLAGKLTSNNIQEISEIFQANKPIKLINTSPDQAKLLEPYGFTAVNRIQFQYQKQNLERLENYINQLPEGYQIKPVDKILFEKLNWRDYMLLFFGNAQNYLNKGFGYCIVKDNIIISEAHACYIGGGMAEIGAASHEDYRNQGFVMIPGAVLIKECFARNLIPISSCNEINIASARASQKIGFAEHMRYQFLIVT